MIERLERAGLGYHVNPDETEDRLGWFSFKILLKRYLEKDALIYMQMIIIIEYYCCFRKYSNASLGIPSATSSPELVTFSLGFWTA